MKGVLLIFLVVGAVAAAFLWKKYSPSKVKYDLAKYYGIENEGQLAITINNEVVEPHGSIEDGKVYIQYDIENISTAVSIGIPTRMSSCIRSRTTR